MLRLRFPLQVFCSATGVPKNPSRESPPLACNRCPDALATLDGGEIECFDTCDGLPEASVAGRGLFDREWVVVESSSGTLSFEPFTSRCLAN